MFAFFKSKDMHRVEAFSSLCASSEHLRIQMLVEWSHSLFVPPRFSLITRNIKADELGGYLVRAAGPLLFRSPIRLWALARGRRANSGVFLCRTSRQALCAVQSISIVNSLSREKSLFSCRGFHKGRRVGGLLGSQVSKTGRAKARSG